MDNDERLDERNQKINFTKLRHSKRLSICVYNIATSEARVMTSMKYKLPDFHICIDMKQKFITE